MKKNILKGIRWTFLSTIIVAILQLSQIVILARFLNPHEFGLIALIMVIVNLSLSFSDFGINMAIIHKQNITKRQLSTLYWLNIITGFFVFIMVLILTPLFYLLYKETELLYLIPLTASIIVIQSFGKQFYALFEKNLQFNIIAIFDVISYFIAFCMSVFLAIKGYGIYAYIIPIILLSIIKTFLLFVFGRKYHIPELVFDIKDVKEFIRFGLYQTGAGIINYFNSHIDIIIIGKTFGTEILGGYSLAKQLTMKPMYMINPVVTRVIFPVMSQMQENIKELEKVYLGSIKYLSMINVVVYSLIIIFAEVLVRIFFGEKWLHIVPIIQLLSIYFAIRSVGNPIGSLLMAIGKTNYEFFLNIAILFIFPIIITICSLLNISSVVYGMIFSMLLVILIIWKFIINPILNISFLKFSKSFFIQFITLIIIFIIYNSQS